MTVSAMVFGEAPGYWPLTTTVGGTISGYSLIGSEGIASRPATVIRIASTVAKIGRSMKKDEIFIAPPYLEGAGGSWLPETGSSVPIVTIWGVTVTPGCTRCAPLTTITSPGFQPFPHDAQAVNHAARLDPAVFDLIVRAQHQHVFLILIGVDGAVVDQDR